MVLVTFIYDMLFYLLPYFVFMRAILYACQAVGLVRVSVGRIVYIEWVGQHSIGLRCEGTGSRLWAEEL